MSLYLYLYICRVFSIKAHSLIQHRCRIATYMTAMKDVTLETTVMEKIRVTPFGHMLIFQPMVVNSFQLDNLCGRYVSNYTFELKKKMIRLTVEDVGIFFYQFLTWVPLSTWVDKVRQVTTLRCGGNIFRRRGRQWADRALQYLGKYLNCLVLLLYWNE